jgi:hypothetical protein
LENELNNQQRLLVALFALFVAIVLHTYFCDWRYSTDRAIIPLYSSSLDSSEYQQFLKNKADGEFLTKAAFGLSQDQLYRASEIRASQLRFAEAATHGGKIYFGIYDEFGLGESILGSPKRTAMTLGVLTPAFFLAFGIFIFLGRPKDLTSLNPPVNASYLNQNVASPASLSRVNWKEHVLQRNAHRNGNSFATAIFVKSVDEEYEWLASQRPGVTPFEQSLVGHSESNFDVMAFLGEGNEAELVYFNVDYFFGKKKTFFGRFFQFTR